jgi:hypothetical protein
MYVKRPTPNKVANCFKSFYIGLADDTIVWFAYGSPDVDQFERPYFFKFDKICDPKDVSKKIFQVAANPWLLLTNFCSGQGNVIFL